MTIGTRIMPNLIGIDIGCGKTKTKNTRVGRHTKGNYGKAIIYSRHDKVQIVYMNQELKEYYNNEGEFSDDNTN